MTKLRASRLLSILTVYFLLSGGALSGCSDPETSARKLYNNAITAQKDNDEEKAFDLYEEIVKKYPGTETAIEANRLILHKSRLLEKEIRAGLDLFLLESGRYPTTEEGLQALVSKPAAIPHWKGPYLEGVAAAQIEDFAYLHGNNGRGRDEIELNKK